MKNEEMLHISLMGGQARALLCESTQMVQTMADIHNATPVCTAALGRLMTGTAMLGVMMKNAQDSVTVTIKGGGPMGTLVAVAQGGMVKAYADDPQVELPLRADGKLDVGGAVGRTGRMSVVKDLGMRKPYVGQCALVSGEMGEDFASYFTISEQQPSLVALGVLTSGSAVLKAGGLLIQPLPGCTEETLSQLELRTPMFADISRELTFEEPEGLMAGWFRGMEPVVLDRTPIRWGCSCSRERMEKALISLGRKDLGELAQDPEGAELSCHFCHSHYRFTPAELSALLERANRA